MTDASARDDGTDRALMRRACLGDEAAFTGLVQRLAPKVHRYLVGRGTREHDADDLVQETFIRVHERMNEYDERWAVSTWVFTIARRQAASQARRRYEVPSATAGDSLEAPVVHPDEDDTWQVAREVLAPREVEALWLRYAEDRTPAEIAAILGITGLHARVLLHRARNRLAWALEENGGDV